MEKLFLSVLGTPEFQRNGAPISFPTRKALALLIYAVLERRIHARDVLMTLFWPDSDTEQARTSLRTTLAYIRKTLPDAPLVIERDSVAFDPYAPLELDIEKIRSAARATVGLPVNQSTLIPALSDAVALIRGDFLSGFSLPDSPDFDNWMAIQREACHRDGVRVLETLSRVQLESDRLIDGLDTVARWIAFDPLDEAAYQRQIQLHLADGNRLAALQSFRACTAMLEREFGVEPSKRTKALIQQAQSGAEAARPVTSPETECITLNRMATTLAQSVYDSDAALDLLRQALHLAKQTGKPMLLAETGWNLAQTYFYRADLEQALAHGTQAIEMARLTGRDDLLGRALNLVGYVHLLLADPIAEVETLADEAGALFRRTGQRALEADTLALKAGARIYTGYPDEALQLTKQVSDISRELVNDWGQAVAAYISGLALLDLGRTNEALAVCTEGLSTARIAGHPPLIIFNLVVMGEVERALNRTGAALEAHQEARQSGDALKNMFFRSLASSGLCADYLALNQIADACRFAQEARDARRRVPYPGFDRADEITALLKGGCTDMALHDLETMRQEAAQHPENRRLQVFLARSRAALAAWQGDADNRRSHLHEAARLAERHHLVTHLRQIQAELAKMSL